MFNWIKTRQRWYDGISYIHAATMILITVTIAYVVEWIKFIFALKKPDVALNCGSKKFPIAIAL